MRRMWLDSTTWRSLGPESARPCGRAGPRVLVVTKERLLGSGLLRQGDQRHAVAGPRARGRQRARGQLDHGESAQRSHNPPAGYVGPDLQDVTVSCDEKQIDWKTHEERMHHVRRRDDQGMPGRKIGAAQEAAIARRRLECRFQMRRNRYACAFVLQDVPGAVLTQKRAEKMRFQEIPGRIIETLMR